MHCASHRELTHALRTKHVEQELLLIIVNIWVAERAHSDFAPFLLIDVRTDLSLLRGGVRRRLLYKVLLNADVAGALAGRVDPTFNGHRLKVLCGVERGKRRRFGQIRGAYYSFQPPLVERRHPVFGDQEARRIAV